MWQQTVTILVSLLLLAPSYADKIVNSEMTNALGRVVSSLPEENCTATKAVYKGEIRGRKYWVTYCDSGKSFVVHTLPDGTGTEVADCAHISTLGPSCDVPWSENE